MKHSASSTNLDFLSMSSRRHASVHFAMLVVAVLMLLATTVLTGCSGKGKTVAPTDLPPSINGIQLVPPRAAPGDTLRASAVAGDPEGKPLVFLWRATKGTLIDSTGQSIQWIAPSVPSTCSLTVRVSDGLNQVSMTRVFPIGIGCLVVESFPQGATVILDAEPTQFTTPLVIPDAAAGDYAVRVQRTPYSYFPGVQNVEVSQGDTTRVRFKLNESTLSMTEMTVTHCVTQSSWAPDGGAVACAVKDQVSVYTSVYVFDAPWPDAWGYDKGVAGVSSWAPSWCPNPSACGSTGCAILYASSSTGSNQIYKASINCTPAYEMVTPQHLVTGVPANYPVWSPSAGQIAFVAEEAGGFSLKTMAASGGVAATIATGVVEDRPTWSPDGNQIAFSKIVDGQPYLFAVSSGGGTPQQISQIPGLHPSWSPDGHKIAFVSSLDGTENVWILFLDALPTPVEGQLTAAGANWPAWRPDNTGLCFTILDPQQGCSLLWLATGSPFPF